MSRHFFANSGSKDGSVLKEVITTIVVSVLLSFLIQHYLFYTAKVPTGSMDPTIPVGSRIIILRVHGVSQFKRGDVLSFKSDELNEVLLKRLIGVSNDKVEVKEDGVTYINGFKIDEPYVKYPGNRLASFDVPLNYLLFMGDNRSNSLDSRYWKQPYISDKKVEGKAVFIFYPLSKFGFIR